MNNSVKRNLMDEVRADVFKNTGRTEIYETDIYSYIFFSSLKEKGVDFKNTKASDPIVQETLDEFVECVRKASVKINQDKSNEGPKQPKEVYVGRVKHEGVEYDAYLVEKE